MYLLYKCKLEYILIKMYLIKCRNYSSGLPIFLIGDGSLVGEMG